MWRLLKRMVTARTRAQAAGQEADVGHDPAQRNNATPFVGRASHDDPGYAGETGAERRAEEHR
jgi:hypothetical protein